MTEMARSGRATHARAGRREAGVRAAWVPQNGDRHMKTLIARHNAVLGIGDLESGPAIHGKRGVVSSENFGAHWRSCLSTRCL